MFVSPFRPVPLRLSLSAVAALADAMARVLHRRGRCDDRLALAFAFRLGPTRPNSLARPRSRQVSKDLKVDL